MSTVALTEETFEEVVTKEGITLVDWWASWCGPCRMFGPIFEAASETHSDITFGKIDTEDQQGLAGAAKITSIPTLMAFRDGVLVFSQAGAFRRRRLRSSSRPSRASTWTTSAPSSPCSSARTRRARPELPVRRRPRRAIQRVSSGRSRRTRRS